MLDALHFLLWNKEASRSFHHSTKQTDALMCWEHKNLFKLCCGFIIFTMAYRVNTLGCRNGGEMFLVFSPKDFNTKEKEVKKVFRYFLQVLSLVFCRERLSTMFPAAQINYGSVKQREDGYVSPGALQGCHMLSEQMHLFFMTCMCRPDSNTMMSSGLWNPIRLCKTFLCVCWRGWDGLFLFCTEWMRI